MFRMSFNKDDGTVSFRSHHGKYLATEESGITVVDRTSVGRHERFHLVCSNSRRSRGILLRAQKAGAWPPSEGLSTIHEFDCDEDVDLPADIVEGSPSAMCSGARSLHSLEQFDLSGMQSPSLQPNALWPRTPSEFGDSDGRLSNDCLHHFHSTLQLSRQG